MQCISSVNIATISHHNPALVDTALMNLTHCLIDAKYIYGMHRWTGLLLVQAISCLLLGIKPLPEPTVSNMSISGIQNVNIDWLTIETEISVTTHQNIWIITLQIYENFGAQTYSATNHDIYGQ